FAVLNKQDGNLISNNSIPLTQDIFLIDDHRKYYLPTRATLEAVDRSTEETVWSLRLDDVILQKPIFSEGIIGVKTNDAPHGKAYLINEVDGSILWESSGDVTGNIVFDKELVYFLDQEAYLNILNYHTNELIGFINFAPPFTELDEVEFFNRRMYLTVKENNIYIHFGDSNQLFAFELEAFKTD
ncbi:MAG: hypothetical protein KDE51_22520, partial [Anaerolineales bacterium]|nr:hypothetical protein [Anaerolineales bacterium]